LQVKLKDKVLSSDNLLTDSCVEVNQILKMLGVE
jgi:hypothetical protein